MRHLAFCVLGICLLACVPSISQEPQRSLHRQFMDAIESEDSKTVQRLLDQGVRANTRPSVCDSTALEWALMLGKIEIAKRLMKAGDTPESLFPGDYRALSEAARRGDTYLLKMLLAQIGTPDIDLCNADRNVWRLLTIATLKKDFPMLQALGRSLSFESIWGNPSNWGENKMHPLAIAIHFDKREAFDQLLSPPILPYYIIQELRSQLPYSHKRSIFRHLPDALSAAAEHGRDDYIKAMLDIDPTLLSDSFEYDPSSDRRTKYLKIVLRLRPTTLKRLWAGGGPEVFPLIGTEDPKHPGIENLFYEGDRRAWNLDGLWQAIAKLHAMGSRPSSTYWWVFDSYIDYFNNGTLSEKEFVDILRPLGSWPLEPPVALDLADDWLPFVPRCLSAIKDLSTVRVMLRAGTPIRSWRDIKGRSLLHHAAHASDDGPSVEKYLLSLVKECGVNINSKDAAGQPALAYVRPLEGFIQFIDRGATIQWPGCLEGHALNRWVANNRNWPWGNAVPWPDYKLLQHPKVAPLLNLAAGQDRRTPLTTACEMPQNFLPQGWGRCGTDVLPKDPKTLKQREEERKRAEQEEEKRWQSLRDPLITCLLDAGANANLPDGRGRTPARAAVESQDMVRLRTLIAHPKGLQCGDPEGLLKVLTRGSSFSREALLVLLNKHGIACGQLPAPVDMAPPP